jgi:DNA-binding HxlR family transcriptional regulator
MPPRIKRFCGHLCPDLQLALDVLTRPWNAQILAILGEGPLRFGELGEAIESIGDRMLAVRLKELCERGLIERRVDGGQARYQLTPLGATFPAVEGALSAWGAALARRSH